MAFTPETGTGDPNANSLTTVAFFHDYCTDRGFTVQAAWDDARIQVALVKATDYINQRYSLRFNGAPSVQGQGCAWPRQNSWKRTSDVADENPPFYTGLDSVIVPLGVDQIAPNVVPVDVQRATCELALIADKTDLAPTLKHDELNIVTKKIGPIEIDYNRRIIRPWDVYTKAVRLMSPYFSGSGNQVRLVRS